MDCDEDLAVVLSTMRLALARAADILRDPEPEVQVAHVVGRFVVVRALVWHAPTLAAGRAAIDSSIRAVLDDLRAAGVTLDGPTLAAVGVDESKGDAGSY